MFRKINKIVAFFGFLFVVVLAAYPTSAQYKSFTISPKGDTLNIVDKSGLKQGRWVKTVGELRGEPGYDEEGFYKNDKKNGPWRKYNSTGDILAVENYKLGGKEGVQEYFSFLGEIERHEEWKGYNPNAPIDTIPVWGEGNNVVTSYKLVKAQQYSVPHGEWKYYAQGGQVIKMENYDHGLLLKNKEDSTADKTTIATTTTAEKPEKSAKTKEILDYEKKYSKKKRKQMERDGHTGL